MYMKDLLKQITLEQQEILHLSDRVYVQRHIEDEWLRTTEILILSGIRRCGKSVLMQQLRDRLQEKDFFFNFDDERLANFKLEDFQTLQECFMNCSANSIHIISMKFRTSRVGSAMFVVFITKATKSS